MGHDPFARRRGVHLFEGSPCNMGRGRVIDQLHKGGRYGPNNCIEEQLVLFERENMVRIRGGGGGIR